MLTATFLADWKQEFREIADYIQACADWISHFTELELPLCAEARRRLRVLQARMQRHFERELELGQTLSSYHQGRSIEVESVRDVTLQGHKHLLARLQNLIGNLEKTECEAIDWSSVAFELNLFLDAFEQHQEHEEESITWLLPHGTSTDPLNHPSNAQQP